VSLRTRLLLAIGIVAAAALVIADVVTYQELRSFLYSRIDQSLDTSHMPIERALGAGGPAGSPGVSQTGGPGGPPPLELNDFCPSIPGMSQATFNGLTPGTFIEVRSKKNAVVFRCSLPEQPGSSSTTAPVLPARVAGFAAGSGNADEPTTYFTVAGSTVQAPRYRGRDSILVDGPYAGDQLILAVPLGSTLSTLDKLLEVELAVTGAALLAATLLGWWLVRLGLRPLRAVELTAEAIAEGELAERVPGDRAHTEVGRLARALNVMLERIESAFTQRDATEEALRASEARMRRFVGDASHELRTPLAAVSAYAELFERGASGRPGDLERVMNGIRIETARMGNLVEDLLLLAHLDEGRPLEREDVELVGLAAEAVRTALTVGPQWPVRLDAAHPVEVTGDRLRLRQVLDNLLSNVRAHAPAGTPTVVTIVQDGTGVVLAVADEGPGLSRELSAQVFERFFRADPSRSRLYGGAGLGLSIVASIIAAHGGDVTAAPGVPHGTVFTVRLPAAPAAPSAPSAPSAPADD
jgi:two-component system, OmpR family, sensor kinase